ncbi:hypothetical protein GOFOIKOB_4029 [Methylobacterium tardum]|uniref:Uncharacterized protein n=1 Tax=Methylobacterium tardum TaxID=374432 RepID=A0AA37TFL9_9HYPH|nr:hypothetical protein [Methylobacterium tardum]URD38192.1 hypothetical protein M6G65_06950 [Methylobacterium tardum]GJE50975.1 hypothetical protein GOFOIKOB_4029 [Methylobacterium tardum]GLS69983.1 hypothetical protein GCM10007890_19960 [Methylobacterium tardum]
MSALRNNTGKLQPLTRADDMAFVGGERTRSHNDAGMVRYLQANPNDARMIGRAIQRMRRNLSDAYPGETRDRHYSNADWRQAGYDDVAAVNELLGLDGR